MNSMSRSEHTIAVLGQENAELRAKLTEAEQRLGNLLALIHCDGGHYIAEHGWEKAHKDAIKIWNRLRSQDDKAVRLEAEVARLRAALGAIDDEIQKANDSDTCIGNIQSLVLVALAAPAPSDHGIALGYPPEASE